MEQKIKTAAAYIRVSTDEQTELSPDSQRDQILEYAKRNISIVPEEFIFIEGEKKKGLSGRKAANRPKFQQMIALAKEKPKPFDCILLWKFSRFARNIDEATYYKSILRNKCGIDVISISEPIMEGMYGRLIEMIIEWSDEFYSFNLATEVKRGMFAKARAGEFCAYAPFGYKMVDKKLVVDDDMRETVKEIFKEYAAGGKAKQIAKRLTALGYRTKFNNVIDNRFIKYIVTNPVYKGYVVLSTEGKRKRDEIIDESKVIYQKGVHEPIVDEELWQKCYDRYLNEKGKKRRETRIHDYALRSLIKCGNCGATLTRSADERLQCSRYNRGVCDVSHSFAIAAAEKIILAQMKEDASNLALFSKKEKKKTVEKDTSALEASIKRKIARLDEAYLNDTYSLSEYKEIRSRLQAELAEIEEKRKIDEDTAIHTGAKDILNFLKTYKKLSPREQNLALIKIIDKIIAHKTENGYHFEIFYN